MRARTRVEMRVGVRGREDASKGGVRVETDPPLVVVMLGVTSLLGHLVTNFSTFVGTIDWPTSRAGVADPLTAIFFV